MKVKVLSGCVAPDSRTIIGAVALKAPVHRTVSEYPETRTVRGAPATLLSTSRIAEGGPVAEPQPARTPPAASTAPMKVTFADLRHAAGIQIIDRGYEPLTGFRIRGCSIRLARPWTAFTTWEGCTGSAG